jgi:hypothetical protein
MTQERASLGFDDALEDFNPNDWEPSKPKKTAKRPKPEATEQVAKASGFKSREVKPESVEKGQGSVRRRRTGRNAQFNLKAKPETIEAYCAIADRQGWGLGETLEKAVELLEQEYRR